MYERQTMSKSQIADAGFGVIIFSLVVLDFQIFIYPNLYLFGLIIYSKQSNNNKER